MSVRVRFAPSPTGPLHIGAMRTALFNYLFAKKNNGKIILRIEDTDSSRCVENAQNYIQNSFKWCGISFDESPEKGGKYAPYIQSQRKEIYQYYLNKLLTTDSVYFAFDYPDEIATFKKKYKSNEGGMWSYNQQTRKKLRNSLTLSTQETKSLIEKQVPYVIRFKTPENRKLILKDLIRGTFSVETQNLDDKILIKTDGTPTYHFANVVDDFTMKISHVIRGEEWLPSLPLHVLLYEALGFDLPIFAHLPLILNPKGSGKLSKRDGDQLGFAIFPLEWIDNQTKSKSIGYKEEGYFPEAFLNMLVLLGWTPNNNQEILSLDDMIKQFELEKVHSSGAHFNIEKNKWINRQYLLKKSDEELLNLYHNYLHSIKVCPTGKDLKIIQVLKERIQFVKEIHHEGAFFYQKPKIIDEKSYEKIWNEDTQKTLQKVFDSINALDWSASSIQSYIENFSKKHSISIKKILSPIRLKLVGTLRGPAVPVIMEILGKKECLERIFN